MPSRVPEALASEQREFAGLVTSFDDTSATLGDLEDRLRADRAIPAQQRLRVYANAYFARIHAVLRDDFGALHATLGDDAFHDLAKLYLIAHPSRTFSLRFVGEHLPAFLAGPVGEPFRRRWPSAADLAALERAISDVFDAPDAPVLSRDALAAVPAERWEGLRFELIAAWQLLRLDWPVHRTRQAWEAEVRLPSLEPATTWILVHRRGEQVLHRTLSDLEAHALECVEEGRALGDVCARVAEVTGQVEAPVQVFKFLERWLADEVLSGLTA
jgi:hypothetical protein